MTDLSQADYEAAAERGRILQRTEPHAASARYDRQADRVVVELTNGSTFAFPPRLAQGLERATPDQLAEVEVIAAGHGLHWETLDVDFTVPGLMAGRFGTRAHMAGEAGSGTPVGSPTEPIRSDPTSTARRQEA